MGNHEFDRGIAGVVPFMEHLKSPVIVANIDDRDEPTFQGKYRKSIIIDKYKHKIGVIGAIFSSVDVSSYSKMVNLLFKFNVSFSGS